MTRDFLQFLNQNQGCSVKVEVAEPSKEMFLMLQVGSGEIHTSSALALQDANFCSEKGLGEG